MNGHKNARLAAAGRMLNRTGASDCGQAPGFVPFRLPRLTLSPSQIAVRFLWLMRHPTGGSVRGRSGVKAHADPQPSTRVMRG